MKLILLAIILSTILGGSVAGLKASQGGEPPPHQITVSELQCSYDANGKLNCAMPPMPTPVE